MFQLNAATSSFPGKESDLYFAFPKHDKICYAEGLKKRPKQLYEKSDDLIIVNVCDAHATRYTRAFRLYSPHSRTLSILLTLPQCRPLY